jgi:hypothetical protein
LIELVDRKKRELVDNKLPNKSSPEKTYLLRRWGLSWIILGFLVLLQDLFGLNFFIIALGLILMGIATPTAKHKTHWMRGVLEYVGYFTAFIVVFFGLIWLSKVFALNIGTVLSATSLAIGIFLQVLAELFWKSEAG